MPEHVLHDILHQLQRAAHDAGRPAPRLLAVSKTKDETAVADLVLAGQTAFGENYVQEAKAKRAAMAATAAAGRPLEWHLIGHLQSNKAAEAAALFDWVQTVDRAKLVAALARHRDARAAPLNVLIQVNIDDEASKHGCRPEEAPALAVAIAAESRLRLRGLMVIPVPHPDPALRRPAFQRAKAVFDAIAAQHGPAVDTLSMGMSDDYPIAIAEGATMVRIGTALFGARG